MLIISIIRSGRHYEQQAAVAPERPNGMSNAIGEYAHAHCHLHPSR